MRKLHFHLLLVCTLFLTGCLISTEPTKTSSFSITPSLTASPSQTLTPAPTITTESDAAGLPGYAPIIVARLDDQEDKTLVIARDLTGSVEFPPLVLPKGSRLFDQPVISSRDVLSIVGGNIYNLSLYRVSPGGLTESIHIETAAHGTGLYWGDYLLVYSPITNLLQLVSPDLKLFDLLLESEYLNDGIHIINHLINGKNGEFIAFSNNPIQKDGKDYALAWVIHPKTSNIEEKLLNLPHYEPKFSPSSASVDKKYLLYVMAISQDLTKIVYAFDYIKNPDENLVYTAYAVYSTLENKDLVVKKDSCYLQSFDQYGDILYQDKYPTNGAGGVILNLDDLSPVFDVDLFVQRTAENRVRILPYGANWLIGTESEVLLVTPDGQLISKYALPADFDHQEYEIAKLISG